ncbi:hypothetical protein N665_0038s0014 [Sinapis alba]|nr:hypothetical protein N665_0038s0014 [Sinapis alba]
MIPPLYKGSGSFRLYQIGYSGSTSGGLALYYNNEFQVNILYTSNSMIDVEAVIMRKKVYISFVYGDPVQKLRIQLWERLSIFGLVRMEPWFVIGDLNEITRDHENQGDSFKKCMIFQFPAPGNQMSWEGNIRKEMIRCRLDQALENEDQHFLFPCSYTEYLGMVVSTIA